MLLIKLALGRRIVALSTMLGAFVFPLPTHAQICAPFNDVSASNGFCSNIQWMYNRGITLGCVAPPGQTWYCPADFVRRDQMAAFMYRLGFQNAYLRGGNAFAATATLGTTDNHAVEVLANSARVMRFEPHAISPNVIGGSPANNVSASVYGATIAGGGVSLDHPDTNFLGEAPNRVTDAYGTVGGGYGNRAGDDAGTTVNRAFATVSGGESNAATGFGSTVGGGSSNAAAFTYSTVGGGHSNIAANINSTVGGGDSNTAGGLYSTVGGGDSNTAAGNYSTIPGGLSNTTSGIISFAAGYRANANADGCFVWGDSTTFNQISCNAANRFVVRSLGGVYFFAGGDTQATYTGVVLPPGGTAWVPGSDRRIKDNFRAIDTHDVLRRLLAMPITTWNLKAQEPSIRHMGPMAQDFRAAFGLGETELGINTLDADGVAFAAIQGLNAKLEAEVVALRAELAAIRALLAGH